MEKDLLSVLQEYSKQDYYPFHMPGHKRNTALCSMGNPYGLDITEIDGFDNLHDAQGILKSAMQEAAELYGAEETFFLVNGSSCGILAAVCACTKPGDAVLIARNCHKSAYHALYLQDLKPVYLYPQIEQGIQSEILAEDVELALKQHPDIRAVILVSPTYEGVVSEIETIAALAHAANCPLIVDEAHGAHFGMAEGFPETAVRLGADLVIQSVHKTLPSFTQTALLHIGKEATQKGRIDRERLHRYLSIFQSSSPSYLLMAGIQRSLRILKKQGKQLFSELLEKIAYLRKETENLQYIHILSLKHMEPSKLNIFIEEASGRNGHWLYRELLERYHLQMEMESLHYVLAMTSAADTREGFERLALALREIDAKLQEKKRKERERGKRCCHGCKYKNKYLLCDVKKWNLKQGKVKQKKENIICADMKKEYPVGNKIKRSEYNIRKKTEQQRRKEQNILPIACSIQTALNMEKKEISLKQAEGLISAEYLYLYPPGIPLVVPGEIFTKEVVLEIKRSLYAGLEVKGISERRNVWIVIEK